MSNNLKEASSVLKMIPSTLNSEPATLLFLNSPLPATPLKTGHILSNHLFHVVLNFLHKKF